MPLVSVCVGSKRVHLTAYCPDDELGPLPWDFVLTRVAELLDKLDVGWKLPKDGDFPVDLKNIQAETRITRHLLGERVEPGSR